jgi:metallophosphoesterase (TIGR00282 family)
MKISVLYFGDIVGRPGREAIAEALPQLREEFQPDLVLANIENATHGRGVMKKHYDELRRLGIDAFSSGDHIWHNEDIFPHLDNPDVTIARPANYGDVQGRGYVDIIVKGKRVRVVNLLGRVFTGANVDNPFHTADKVLAQQPAADVVIVDFHAEATSEKRMLAEYLDGRAQLVVGTHTHVPTADAQILPHGTAFISDLGMVGPKDSSLGAEKTSILKSFLTGQPWRYSLGEGECELGAVFCEIDVDAKQALSISHIRRFTTSVS